MCSIPNKTLALILYEKSLNKTTTLVDLRLCGDFEWDTKTNTFYLLDACEKMLRAFDWIPATGALSTYNYKCNKLWKNNFISQIFFQKTIDKFSI